MAETPSSVVYRFLPKNEGDFIGGVPARDLTQSEWNELDPVLRVHAEASGIYQAERTAPAKEAPITAPTPDSGGEKRR